MKLMKWPGRLIGALAVAATLQAADALLTYGPRQITKPDGTREGSKVTVDGDSSIHAWTVFGSIIIGVFEIEPAFQTDVSLKSVSCFGKGKAPKVEVSIPISSLHNKGGYQKMDEIMAEAMKADQAPKIFYKCTEMTIKGDVPAAGTPVKFDTKGELAVAGVTNKTDMVITLERLDNGMIKFSGTNLVKMTSFKITPPAPKIAAGLIKTADEVALKLEWVLGLKTPPPAAEKK